MADRARSSGIAAFLFGVIVTLMAVGGWIVWSGLDRAPAEGVAGLSVPTPNLPDFSDLPDQPLPTPTDPLPDA